jgi:hypothetical protein
MIFFNSEERKLKKQIFDRARAMAEDSYKKEIMFRSLQASDLHYAIIQDLMKAATMTGIVTITLKDGSVIKIENRQDARADLNRIDGETLY